MSAPLFSIVILTKNSLGVVNRLVESLRRQNFAYEYEVLFMDNGSSDGTVAYLESLSLPQCRVYDVAAGEFSHSGTRMRAAELARGRYVVFFTDDIVPCGDDFLENLTRPVRTGQAAAAYGVWQISPEMGHDPIDAYLHNGWFKSMDDFSEPVSPYCWSHFSAPMQRRLCNFDNCSSCIDRELLLELLFPAVPYGEDMLFAKRLILSGRRVALSKEARFIHWHRVKFGYILRRMCIDQDLSVREFRIYYVSRLLGVFKAILKRVLHRTYVGLFKVKIPFFKKIYWIVYNAKVLTADFWGKYIGTLDPSRLGGCSWLKKRLYARKLKIINDIERKSIRRY